MFMLLFYATPIGVFEKARETMNFQSVRLKKLKFNDVQKPTNPTLMKLERGLKFVTRF